MNIDDLMPNSPISTYAQISVGEAQHFEFCPGAYGEDALLVSDLNEEDAVIDYYDIRAGVAGMPARHPASFDPNQLAEALDAFFNLARFGKPLFYNGTYDFLVKDKNSLIEELSEYFKGDEDCAERRAWLEETCNGLRPVSFERSHY